jgi:hypothetical protein
MNAHLGKVILQIRRIFVLIFVVKANHGVNIVASHDERLCCRYGGADAAKPVVTDEDNRESHGAIDVCLRCSAWSRGENTACCFDNAKAKVVTFRRNVTCTLFKTAVKTMEYMVVGRLSRIRK